MTERLVHSSYILLEGIYEVIGRPGVQAIFNHASCGHLLKEGDCCELRENLSLADVNALCAALDETYGPLGGRGVAQRAGRASFKYVLQYLGDELGLTTLEFRLMPTRKRMRRGLEILAENFSKATDNPILVSADEKRWFWRVQDCPECSQRKAEEPVCHFTVGFLQEYLSWVGNGKYYSVTEVECQAAGGACCVFQMDQRPLD